MYSPPIFFDPKFVDNVIIGYLITLVGALALLLAGVWLVRANEWLDGRSKPTAWRALCALGLGLFVVGIVWQLIGYTRVGVTTWSSP